MGYELEVLDSFVEKNFNPKNLLSSCNEEHDLIAMRRFIKDEQERLRLAFINTACTFQDPKSAEIYIKSHQDALVFLANRLQLYKEPDLEKVPEFLCPYFLNVFDELQECIEFLLAFIERYFDQYFDKESAITDKYFDLLQLEVQKLTDQIILQSTESTELPIYLLVCTIIQKRIAKEEMLTYRLAFYIRELLQMLASMPENLENELIYFNFNDQRFLDTICNRLVEETNEQDTEQAKLYFLRLKLKQYKQISKRPNIFYSNEMVSVSTYLVDWLSAEIEFHEKKGKGMELVDHLLEDPTNKSYEKLKLNLSVGQLGLLSRLLMEHCFAFTPTHKKIAVGISKSFSTKRAGNIEDISVESLLGKFYKHDHASKAIVSDLLFDMSKRIQEL
jgi:hypothetical protein